MNKTEYFKEEIERIKTDRLKTDCSYLVEKIPHYFFEIGASSSGKYHPQYALGEGGLLRHTKAAIFFLHTYLEHPLVENDFSDEEKDLMTIALLLHDAFKRGYQEEAHTAFEHPVLAANFIEDEKDNLSFSEDERALVKQLISSHMGPWNKNKDKEDENHLPIPRTKMEKLVHFCDYFASRKQIEVLFDENDKILIK